MPPHFCLDIFTGTNKINKGSMQFKWIRPQNNLFAKHNTADRIFNDNCSTENTGICYIEFLMKWEIWKNVLNPMRYAMLHGLKQWLITSFICAAHDHYLSQPAPLLFYFYFYFLLASRLTHNKIFLTSLQILMQPYRASQSSGIKHHHRVCACTHKQEDVKQSDRKRESVCVCVCICVIETESLDVWACESVRW